MASELTSNTHLIGGRYRVLSMLGRGGMGTVYRVYDRLTGQAVALKQVVTKNDALRPDTTPLTMVSLSDISSNPHVSLAHEFRALATLRHPHIIGVQDYGFIEGQPYFTMELLDKADTILVAGRDNPLTEQVNLLVQMLQALSYIHRRNLVHRDLKPGNVLVADGEVKVLDFGLSMNIERARGTSGTLAYMAPEVLYGDPAGVSADLYAVGVIAFQLFTGKHPYDGGEGALVSRILTSTPNWQTEGLTPELMPIVRQLLAKQANERPASAEHVIHAFGRAIGHNFAVETAATRESFLQAARFVGREHELFRLKNALQFAIETKGNSWLIGGESGVGKSRLVEEVRTLALVRGAMVVRGITARTGGRSYLLWRDVIRRLILDIELTDLETSVLQTLVPDIGTLLERKVEPPPPLDLQASRTRLFSSVASVIRKQSQKQPLVLLLEDLQWAGGESLALLSSLNRMAAELPIMIVGNYRDNEAPDLPESLPLMEVMSLKPLSDTAVQSLGEAIMGPAGKESAVITMLQQETAGNPFFLIEIMRALAEEVGQLTDVGTVSLTAQLLQGGVQRLVERRLNQLPAGARPLLEFSAIAGRQINPSLLNYAFNEVDIEAWLTTCANATLLDLQDNSWLFAHDQLRDGLLTRLPTSTQKALHQQVAETIEAVYPNSAEQAGDLAYHWHEAGNTAKEAYFAELAGAQALQNGANQDAVRLLKRTLEIGTFSDHLDEARVLRQLGQAYLGLGELVESRNAMEEMVAMLGWPIPPTTYRFVRRLVKQLFVQGWRRARPGSLPNYSDNHKQALLETARAYQELSEIYYFANRRLQTLSAALHTLNLAEAAGPSPELARAYANMCVVAGLLNQGRLVYIYSELAQKTASEIGDLPSLAWAHLMLGTYELGRGHWVEAEQSAQQGVELSHRTGDKRVLGLLLGLWAAIPYHRGEFARSVEIYAEWYTVASEIDNIQHQAMSLSGQADVASRLGWGQEAIVKAESSLELVARLSDDAVDLLTPIRSYSALAAAQFRLGNPAGAQQSADKALGLVNQTPPVNRVRAIDGLANLAEVCLALWEQSQTDYFQPSAQRATEVLSEYAKRFPSGRPRAALCEGLFAQLLGKPKQAVRLWQKSHKLATSLHMPYDQALTAYYLGRYASNTQSRHKHLTEAITLFTQLKAPYDLERAKSALVSQP